MGCLVVRNKAPNLDIITGSSMLSMYREKLLLLNMYLHNLANFCRTEIEETLLEFDKKLAVLLKKKLICVNSKQEEVQELIKVYDQYCENSEKNPRFWKKVKKIIDRWVKEVDEEPVYKNYVKIIRESDNEKSRLKKALKNFEFDENKIEIEISEEIQRVRKLQIKGGPTRYKFKRRKSVI